jgi:nuclear pore complex protein Nup98-Nup96
VKLSQDAPRSELHVNKDSGPLAFSELADKVALDVEANNHEKQAWDLLSLLFDQPEGVNANDSEEHKARVRKDRLSQFWRSLVYEDAQKHARDASTPEEKAIAYLSCNSIANACDALLHGFDLRLATMVAQIGGNATTREDMMQQIEEWRRMDVLAEMDEPIRALYELIAGNCGQSEGKTGGGRENKASTFNIARQFNLDWRRAFGLRLWYGIMVDESIEMAVAQYADALAFGKEDVKPVPWFVKQGEDMGWTDPNQDDRQDLLWGVLKLYASAKMDAVHVNVEEVLAPENVSGHPLNARLSFQLFHFLKSRRGEDVDKDQVVNMPTTRGIDGERSALLSSTATDAGDEQAKNPLVELGDKLAITYAASLHTREHWTTAVWVYTYLSRADMRAHYIRSLLDQFSSTYTINEESDETCRTLLKLDVPRTWMHAAAALQAKVEGDALEQAMHLIQASASEEAHEVLCRSVGPACIISRDYDDLRELLDKFLPAPKDKETSKDKETADYNKRFGRTGKTKEPVRGWNQGGAIYCNYMDLLNLTAKRFSVRNDEALESRITECVSSLQKALEVVANERWADCGLEERVALSEIAGDVAEHVATNKVCILTTSQAQRGQKLIFLQMISNKSCILHLPLTEDLRLKHTLALSTTYYRNLNCSR